MAHSLEAEDNSLKSTSADSCTSQGKDITAFEYQTLVETISYSIKQEPKDEALFQLIKDNNLNNNYTEMPQSYYNPMNQFNQLYEPLFGYNQNNLENNLPMNPLENINANYDQAQVPQSNNIAQCLMENQIELGFINDQNEFSNDYISNTIIESNLNFNQDEKVQSNDFTQFQSENPNYSVLSNNLTFMDINHFIDSLDFISIPHSQAQNTQLRDFNQNQQSNMIRLELGDSLNNLANDTPMNPIEVSNMAYNKTQKPEQNDSTKYISDILNLPVTGEYLNNLSNSQPMDPFGESLLINNQVQGLQPNEIIQQEFNIPEQTVFGEYINSLSNAPNLVSLGVDNKKSCQKRIDQKNNFTTTENSPTEKYSKTPALTVNSSQKRQLDKIDEDSQASKTQKLNNTGLKDSKKLNLNIETLNTSPQLSSKKLNVTKNLHAKSRKLSVKICTKKNTSLTFEFNSIIESKRKIRAKEHIIPISIIKAHKPFEYVTEGILSKTENEIDEETEANTELNGCVWNEDS